MASKPDSPVFTNNEKIILRLTCIHRNVTTDVLRFTFENDTKDRPQHMPLVEYYKSKGITGFNKNLNKEQKKHINNDPTGATFDITLLYTCLRNGSCYLAPKDDDKWTLKDGSCIESLIGIVKDKRNSLAHEQLSFTNKQLLEEVQLLQDILIKIIKCCGQLYSLPDAITDPKIKEVEVNVKRYLYGDFDPKTVEEYRKELIFDALAEKVKIEGVKDLEEQYDKHCEDKVSTMNHLVDISLPLDHIYTEMRLKGESATGQEESTEFEEVLLNSGKTKTDDVIVISGVAGAGKTTFTKKILHDWRYRLSVMEHLIDHDILLKSECRNTAVKCFEDLLLDLMPRVSRDFKPNDLRNVILAQNVLQIVDGLDELNKNSADLFEEILCLKKTHKISLLVTTRPEKLSYLKNKIKSYQLGMKHIELIGVPLEKRAELVTKYYNAIAKKEQEKNKQIQDVSGLLAYLEKTMYRLADLWKLPYNLTLITMLWAYDYMKVDAINTAPELYREILKLYMSKLMDRLRSSEVTNHLPESILKRNVEIFLKRLAKESLIGLKDNHLTLSKEAYKRLLDVCNNINIPIEEPISAFVKRLPGAEDIYSFHHKGLQDYLAALYIWMEVTNKSERIDIQNVIDHIAIVLDQHDIDFYVGQNILMLTEQELNAQSSTAGFFFRKIFNLHHKPSIIGDIMQKIHESSTYHTLKFQNMFIFLIGLFYLESGTVQEQTKLEALKLLQKSGVQNKEHWITVLNSVKCDDYVASFISKQPSILDGSIQITDSSASAYVSLMQALKPPLKNAHTVEVYIDIKDDLEDSSRKLFQLINSHKFKVKTILMNDKNFKSYMEMLEELKIPFVDAGSISAKVDVDEDLRNIMKLLKLIEENGITVAFLKTRDIDLNDSNFHDIINTLKSLSNISKYVIMTWINLDIEGDLPDIDELQEVIMKYCLRIRRVLVTENNFEKYTHILRALKVSLTFIPNAGMKIMVNKDVTCLTDFLKEILEMYLEMYRPIRVRNFKVLDIDLTDENADEYFKALRLMWLDSTMWWKANTSVVDVQLMNHKNLMTIIALIFELGFKVKTIAIRDECIIWYTIFFRNLKTSLKDAQEVVVDIDVTSDLLTIHDLLWEIKEKKFHIGNLKFGSNETLINDDNVHEYASTLLLLPTLASENHNVELDFRKESPVIGTILKEISKHRFNVRLKLRFGFHRPMLYSDTTVNGLEMVFERCRVTEYRGLISPELTIPLSIKILGAGIPDTRAYLRIKAFLDAKSQSEFFSIDINMSLNVDLEDIVPLVGDLKNPPSLSFTKIATSSDIDKATEIAKKLAPTSGPWKGTYNSLWIFSCKLQSDGIRKFLMELGELNIDCIYFPASCRPDGSDQNTIIQDIAKTKLGCSFVDWEQYADRRQGILCSPISPQGFK